MSSSGVIRPLFDGGLYVNERRALNFKFWFSTWTQPYILAYFSRANDFFAEQMAAFLKVVCMKKKEEHRN